MPRIICRTCLGTRSVRSGGRMLVCPTCRGAGGAPLGQPAPDAPYTAPSGSSRAADFLNRRPVAGRRTP